MPTPDEGFLTVPITPTALAKLDSFAAATNQPPTLIASHAIELYLLEQERRLAALRQGLPADKTARLPLWEGTVTGDLSRRRF